MLPHDVAGPVSPSPREVAPRVGDAGAPRAVSARERTPADLVTVIAARHAHERNALPYVVALLAKTAGRHRGRNAKLGVLCDVGQELADVLEAHADEAERELFPALLAAATAAEPARAAAARIRARHRAITLLLARMRWLADDFAVPTWGGRTYQALMEELESLEDEVVEHLHLEESVLLPRVFPGAERPC
ncbi:MAG TPA: hemerythrin domain-containing protein [Anaeromyxobacter sp.]